jgi:hypothetical protein
MTSAEASSARSAGASTAPPLPTEDEVRAYFESCSNWGRWGPDDSKGTINLITPEKRLRAASLVRTGRSISLAYPLNTTPGFDNKQPAQHYMKFGPEHSADYIGLYYHGYATTHIDALCHLFWEGKMWNGRPSSDVTSVGAVSGGVDAWSGGIATRGVLLDIPRLRGTSFVELGEPVRGWELEAAAEAQGVALEPGDAVVVCSGRPAYYAAHPDRIPGVNPKAGLHVDVIPVLRRHDAAVLVWDMMDAQPNGYELFGDRQVGPVHILAIAYLGLPLVDNSLLEPLARACVEEGRWEFMLTINPLVITGGTGGPVNPVAIF